MLSFGFQSIDEDASLIAVYGNTPVMLNNENVMEKVKATGCPGSFGRQLRLLVFGEDGLVFGRGRP